MDTLTSLWLAACRQQIVSSLTRKSWDRCEVAWRGVADASRAAGLLKDAEIFGGMADEAAAKHIIERAVE